jgi:hypothetical protein
MCIAYIVAGCITIIAIYLVYTEYTKNQSPKPTPDNFENIEGFYPRHWWGPNWRWGWHRPWLNTWGNWRPHGYYPAYSGYWKQCPSGTWCPANLSCRSPSCY